MGFAYYPPLSGYDVPWTIPAKTPLRHEKKQNVLISRFANGSEQRRLVEHKPRATWVIRHEGIPFEWFTKISQFYNDRQGSFDSFNLWFKWDNPGGVWEPWSSPAPYKYRFQENGIKVVSIKEIWYDVEVTVVETYEPRD